MVKHFYVKFGDPSCSGFRVTVRKNRQTHRQIDKRRWKPTLASTTGVVNC